MDKKYKDVIQTKTPTIAERILLCLEKFRVEYPVDKRTLKPSQGWSAVKILDAINSNKIKATVSEAGVYSALSRLRKTGQGDALGRFRYEMSDGTWHYWLDKDPRDKPVPPSPGSVLSTAEIKHPTVAQALESTIQTFQDAINKTDEEEAALVKRIKALNTELSDKVCEKIDYEKIILRLKESLNDLKDSRDVSVAEIPELITNPPRPKKILRAKGLSGAILDVLKKRAPTKISAASLATLLNKSPMSHGLAHQVNKTQVQKAIFNLDKKHKGRIKRIQYNNPKRKVYWYEA